MLVIYKGEDITDQCKMIQKMSGRSIQLPVWLLDELYKDEDNNDQYLSISYED